MTLTTLMHSDGVTMNENEHEITSMNDFRNPERTTQLHSAPAITLRLKFAGSHSIPGLESNFSTLQDPWYMGYTYRSWT